ncbi:MAG: hypothetical protein KC414_14170, partial [Romboutsia sp.]|nr:hypothetical protein [Romboutsia sp.]
MSQTIPFTLYDELKSKGPIDVNWNILCPTINKLKNEQAEIIYALIIHYYLINNNDVNQVIRESPSMCKNKTTSITPKNYNITSSYMQNTNSFNIIPYNGKICEGGKGIIYKLEDISDELKNI